MTTPAAIVEVSRERLDEAGAVLDAAFAGDPLMRYLFPDATGLKDERVHALLRFACEERLVRGWPLLGAEVGGQLVGVLGVSQPCPPPAPPELEEAYGRLRPCFGEAAFARFERYLAVVKAQRPPALHIHLGVLAVHPRRQGHGHGRALLGALHSLAEAHPVTRDIGLDTENPANLAFYARFGYRVAASTPLAGLTVWSLYRAGDAG